MISVHQLAAGIAQGHEKIIRTVTRGPRDPLLFGHCRQGCCKVDLVTPGAAGHLVAQQRGWRVANHAESVPVHVWDAERPADLRIVAPRTEIVLPFEIAHVAGAFGRVLTVLASPPTEPSCGMTCAGEPPVAWGLNPETNHFRVMMAIVAPVLDGDDRPPPTPTDVADLLGFTPKQVEAHINHLITRLSIEPPDDPSARDWKRHALTAYARAHAYVPPRRSAPTYARNTRTAKARS